MRGMNRLNYLFFILFRGNRHPHTPQYADRQERIEQALASLQTKTPQQVEAEKRFNERQIARAGADALRGSGDAAGSGPGVLREPQGHGADAHGHGSAADGSNGSTGIGYNESWESLQDKLQQMLQDNPDLREVDLDDD